MKIFDMWKSPFWAPEDGGGSGGDDTAAGAGGTDSIPGGGDDTVPGGGGADTAKWWEDAKRFSDDQRSYLSAKGMTVDDPLDALPKVIDAHRAAERRLGKPADQLMDRPKEGQDIADWLRENGDMFGIPKEADGYKVDRPESWPKDAKWDDVMEADARKIALEEGMSDRALNRMVGLFAGKVQAMDSGAADELASSEKNLMAELQRDWGDQRDGKVTQARQAFALIAQQAGMDEAARMSAAAVLTEKAGGDANVLRMFAAIGEMMGEDSLTGLNSGGGSLTTTPAEARAKLEAMKADGSEYRKHAALKTAGKPNNHADLHQEYLRLQKLANG